MLTEKQLSILKPFFNRYESELNQLRTSSISPYFFHIPITDQKQLFYPWGQRRIFNNITIKQKQTKAINQVKSIIIQEEKFPVNQFTDELILRHLHSTGLDSNAAYQRLKKIHTLQNPKQKQDSFLNYLKKENFQNLEKLLKNGAIYTLGKSSQHSYPVIILQVSKINKSVTPQENFALFYILISTVIHYRMKPHWVEKYIFLVDLGGLSISQIPYKYLYKFIELMGLFFAGMCQKIYVCNAQKIGFLWGVVKRILPDHTVSKVLFVDKTNQKDIFQIIKPEQLQRKYGGKINDLKEYWPPKAIKKQFYSIRDNFKNASILKQLQGSQIEQDNETEYFSFEQIQMKQSVKLGNTYKSLGISRKKNIPVRDEIGEEYEIQTEQFFGKLGNICGLKGDNVTKGHYCSLFL